MELTNLNQIWTKKCAEKLGTTPENFVNVLLNNLREEYGISEDNIQTWMNRGEEFQKKLENHFEKWEETRVLAEETIKTAQLYITQLQQEKKQLFKMER
jgi:hypothetical protein